MIRWVEETLVKAPAADVLFGSLGLIFGLIIAFFVVMPLQSFHIQVLNTVLPSFFDGVAWLLRVSRRFKETE